MEDYTQKAKETVDDKAEKAGKAINEAGQSLGDKTKSAGDSIQDKSQEAGKKLGHNDSYLDQAKEKVGEVVQGVKDTATGAYESLTGGNEKK